MEIIFNKYFVIDNLLLFWSFVIIMVLIMIVTVLLVRRELKGKK